MSNKAYERTAPTENNFNWTLWILSCSRACAGIVQLLCDYLGGPYYQRFYLHLRQGLFSSIITGSVDQFIVICR